MLDVISTLWETLQGQLINIPVNNALGIIYVILNAFLLLFGIGGAE